jgi:DNA-binding protein HU-beta
LTYRKAALKLAKKSQKPHILKVSPIRIWFRAFRIGHENSDSREFQPFYKISPRMVMFFTKSGDVMNKGELVDAVAEKASVTKKQVDVVLSAALEAIVEAVSSGDKVTLVGFGSFESRERKAREGRNPKTGDKMEIPATKVPAFSAGKLFREKVAPEQE